MVHITVNNAPDIIALTEVLPKNTRFPVTETDIKLDNYVCYTNIQEQDATRGVALYIKNNIKSRQSSLNPDFKESVWCEIDLHNNDKLIVGCVYRSPNSNQTNDEKLNAFLPTAADVGTHTLIMGDFNHPEIDWQNEITPQDPNHKASKFMEAIRDSFLHQHVSSPTHIRGEQTPHVLDLILTSEPDMIDKLQHDAPIGKSHHQLLSFSFKAYSEKVAVNKVNHFIFHKGDYNKLNTAINQQKWEEILQPLNTSESWNKMDDILTPLIKDSIPTKKTQNSSSYPQPKWMNRETQDKINKKKRAYKKYLETRSQEDYKLYARYRNQVKSQCRRAVREFTKSLAIEVKTNPKAFYSYIRSRTKTKQSIPDLDDSSGNNICNDNEKARVLNDYFSSVFTVDNDINSPHFEDRNFETPLSNVNISVEEVKKKLNLLKPNKSPGPDAYHPLMFKQIAESIAKPLSIIFNKTLQEGKLPEKWKQANVTPIFKKGDKRQPSNYRPVSLTSIVCKTMETIIRDIIVEHMTSNNLFSDYQHGFIKGRSCATNLLAVLDVWTEAIDKNIPVDAIYLDLAKAFDKVSHTKLLLKLWGYGIRGDVFKWIQDFLKGRVQRVTVNGNYSNWNDVTSGVPQGSVLGPVLFVIFINDLPEATYSVAQMFADDTKLFNLIQNVSDHQRLQHDIDKLVNWANTWKMSFNSSKCKVLHIGRNNPNKVYTMENESGRSTLDTTALEKDLGVHVDPQLNFSQHVEKQANTANKILGMIRRNFEYIDTQVMKRLYTSLVRPHLEFSNVAWSPIFIKDQKLLEGVQRRATKLVPELKHLTYEERLQKMDLPSLYYRRNRGDMIEAYKYLHNYYSINNNLLILHPNSTTRGHPLKLKKHYCRTNKRKQFFANRIIENWNNLPVNIVTAPSLNSFKSRLDKHWKDTFYITNNDFNDNIRPHNRNHIYQDDLQDRPTGSSA